MDLARPGRHRGALRRVRDPPLARLLGDLYPPRSADGVDRGSAPRPRMLVPALVLQHALYQRFTYTYFDVHRIYRHVIFNIWVTNPQIAGVRQIAVFTIAWLHGCIGLYLWLRVRRHFHRVAPFLLAVAVLLPATALLGVFQGARQVEAKTHSDP